MEGVGIWGKNGENIGWRAWESGERMGRTQDGGRGNLGKEWGEHRMEGVGIWGVGKESYTDRTAISFSFP